jgi:hypothetical protein
MAGKSGAILVAPGTSNTAGSTTTSTSLDLTTANGAVILANITNGGTGPAIGCSVTINVSSDNSTWKRFATATAGTANNGVYWVPIEIPQAIMWAQVVFSGNTGQTVTVEATAQILDTI